MIPITATLGSCVKVAHDFSQRRLVFVRLAGQFVIDGLASVKSVSLFGVDLNMVAVGKVQLVRVHKAVGAFPSAVAGCVLNGCGFHAV